MYKLHTHCRVCCPRHTLNSIKSKQPESTLVKAASFGPMPLVNDFKTESEEHQGYAPLDVMICTQCGLAQLSVVVDPGILYKDYSYITSDSQTMKDHFHTLMRAIQEVNGPLGSVLEIGSNNGAFLSFLRQNGITDVTGVDPAENLCSISEVAGIKTIRSVFNHQLSQWMNDSYDTVIARHVFCHVDDWHDFILGLYEVTHPDSIVAIEVPYVGNMLAMNEWDTIYHEHLSYLSINAMNWLLRDTVFSIRKIQFFPLHGGSMVVFLSRSRDESYQAEVNHMAVGEGFDISRWRQFEISCGKSINQLSALVTELRNDGKKVCGYGAPAKASNWIAACGFTRDNLDYVCDTTPQKQGRLIPGSDIPVVSPEEFRIHPPDVAILFPWNFKDEILIKESEFRSRGGQFIIPVPSVQLV